jgi:hypothetical protein
VNAPDPSTYPSILNITQAASVARVPARVMRRWVDVGRLPARNTARNATRYIRAHDLLAICDRLNIEPDWDALAETL